MRRKRAIRLRCPICKKPVKNTDPGFPFCSERCRTVDLGKWASGAYVVSSPIKDTSDISAEGEPEEPDKRSGR
jgi:hypothetical protein